MRRGALLPGCLLMLAAAGLGASPGASGSSNPTTARADANVRPTQVPAPVPPPAIVSPGTESEARGVLTQPFSPGASAESSARQLQPGAGDYYVPPPPIPPVPPSMHALEAAEAEEAGRPPLNLEVLEKMACQNNPTLKQAHAVVESTFGAAIQAGLWPNPSIAYMGMAIGMAGTPGMFEGAMLNQPIITAGKRRLDRARFLEQTKAGQWEAMAVEYRVLNDVRVHYFRDPRHAGDGRDPEGVAGERRGPGRHGAGELQPRHAQPPRTARGQRRLAAREAQLPQRSERPSTVVDQAHGDCRRGLAVHAARRRAGGEHDADRVRRGAGPHP